MMPRAEAHVAATNPPTISVIMANFNGGVYLAEAVGSVQRQTLRSLELIVSDDGSTDNSIDIVQSLQATDPRIRLLQTPRNAGPAAARNRAISAAVGEWIAIMDSDDVMHPERLAKLLTAATEDEAELVADDLELLSDSAQAPQRLLRGRWSKHPFWVDIEEYVRLNALYGNGPALGYLKPLIRTAILREYDSPYDEKLRLAEDYNLVLRLLHDGNAMRVYPLALYYYRRHSASTSHRLSEGALIDLQAAELRFLERLARDEKRLRRAMRAKIRSTAAALAYERLLISLKHRAWRSAVVTALAQPRAALLLRLPLGARVRRLVSRTPKATAKRSVDAHGNTRERPHV
jgi:glycosyltransferase involved in cell wall biosynthesis